MNAMSKATEQLAEKEHYVELSEKQKAVIMAYAENPDATHSEIYRKANEKLGEDDESISRAYVPVVLDKYENIAYEQMQIAQNGREEGDEEYDNVAVEEQVQAIQEIDDSDEKTVSIELTRNEVKEIANAPVPDSIKTKIFNRLLDESFAEAE